MKFSLFLICFIPFSLFFFNNSASAIDIQEDPYKPFAEVMPELTDGLAAVYKNIIYPDMAKKAGVEGKVYVLVYVNEKGSVDDVKIVKGIGAGCDEAAINAFKKASFSPGKDKGTPIKVKLTLPVTFKIK